MPPQPPQPSSNPAVAIAGGYFAQVRYLLEQAGGQDERHPETGRTPLILCSLIRDTSWAVSLARLLLEKGARVGLKDTRGMNALHYACACGRVQLAELYLDAVDYRVNEKDRRRNTPMHFAAASGCVRLVKLLADAQLRFQLPVSLQNRDGVTPLMTAYQRGFFDVAECLLACGADPDVVDSFGKSTIAYEREALTRRRLQEEAREAKKSGRRLRFDDVAGWRRHQIRLRSAPPLRKSKTFKEEQQEKRRADLYQPDVCELIDCASELDRRNDPLEVFKASPVEFFSRSAAIQESTASPSGEVTEEVPELRTQSQTQTRRLRARSAAPAVARDRRERPASPEDSDRSADSLAIRIVSLRPPSASAKRDIQRLFHDYEFHCSSLYRPPPKMPDPQLHVTDFNARFLQPPAAEADASGSVTPVKGARGKKEARKAKKSTSEVGATKKKGGRVSRAAFNRDE